MCVVVLGFTHTHTYFIPSEGKKKGPHSVGNDESPFYSTSSFFSFSVDLRYARMGRRHAGLTIIDDWSGSLSLLRLLVALKRNQLISPHVARPDAELRSQTQGHRQAVSESCQSTCQFVLYADSGS